jgi:hypothetical protein
MFLGATYPNGENIPKGGKLYQIAIKCTKRPENCLNGHIIYPHFQLQDPAKFTQIRIFWFENIPSGNPGSDLSDSAKLWMACRLRWTRKKIVISSEDSCQKRAGIEEDFSKFVFQSPLTTSAAVSVT